MCWSRMHILWDGETLWILVLRFSLSTWAPRCCSAALGREGSQALHYNIKRLVDELRDRPSTVDRAREGRGKQINKTGGGGKLYSLNHSDESAFASSLPVQVSVYTPLFVSSALVHWKRSVWTQEGSVTELASIVLPYQARSNKTSTASDTSVVTSAWMCLVYRMSVNWKSMSSLPEGKFYNTKHSTAHLLPNKARTRKPKWNLITFGYRQIKRVPLNCVYAIKKRKALMKPLSCSLRKLTLKG